MPGIRVVVIDDEPDTVSLLRAYMEMVGLDVATALNGAAGLQAVATHKPQVLVLDLMLPDMDGYEIAEKLRADPATAELPIIVLSARTGKEDVKRGYTAGASLYLKKPVDLVRLVEEIKKAAEGGRHVPRSEEDQEKDAAATPGRRPRPPAPPTPGPSAPAPPATPPPAPPRPEGEETPKKPPGPGG